MNFLSAIPLQYRLQIAIVILCIAEAWLEEVVIRLKNPASGDYTKNNRDEHRRSAVYYGAVVCLMIFIAADYTHWYILVPLMLVERRIFFEYSLKLFRGRGIRFIEGDQYWDKFSRNIFGYKGGVKELLCLIAIVIATNIFT